MISRAGKLFIDGLDAYTVWGVFVTENGHSGLLSYPEAKEPTIIDWGDESGVQVDLSALRKQKSRVFSINFATDRLTIEPFIVAITTGVFHSFNFTEIAQTYSMRLISQPAMNVLTGWKTFSLQFAIDTPIAIETPITPLPTSLNQTGYDIDAIPFSDYTVLILEGTAAEFMKAAPVKSNLTRDISIHDGLIYDPLAVHFQQKEVTLKCCFVAPNLTTFWRNYNALFYTLMQANARVLSVDVTASQYDCYYKNMNVTKLTLGGDVWVNFDLTLVLFTDLYAV